MAGFEPDETQSFILDFSLFFRYQLKNGSLMGLTHPGPNFLRLSRRARRWWLCFKAEIKKVDKILEKV